MDALNYKSYKKFFEDKNVQVDLTEEEYNDLMVNNCSVCGGHMQVKRKLLPRLNRSIPIVNLLNVVLTCYPCHLIRKVNKCDVETVKATTDFILALKNET